MNIVIASPGMQPSNIRRQPWHYMHQLALALVKLGHTVTIMTDCDVGEEHDHYRYLSLPGFRKFPSGISKECLTTLRSFDCVFWSTGVTDFFNRTGLRDIPIKTALVFTSPLYSVRDFIKNIGVISQNVSLIKPLLISPLLTKKRVKRTLDSLGNLIGTLFMTREAQEDYGVNDIETPLSVIPPYPAHEFLEDLSASVWLSSGGATKKVIYFGPPLVIRGVRDLIDAVAEIKESGVSLEILARTDNDEMKRYESQLREHVSSLGLEEVVTFTSGMLSWEELEAKISSARVVALPFRLVVSEAPVVTLETLLSGIPLIGSDKAGLKELPASSALRIVEAGDTRSLADALRSEFERSLSEADFMASRDIYRNYLSQRRFNENVENFMSAIEGAL